VFRTAFDAEAAYHALHAKVSSEIDRVIGSLRIMVDGLVADATAKCPSLHVLNDAQIVAQQHLKDEVLNNPHNAAIPDVCLKLIDVSEHFGKYGMFTKFAKKLSSSTHLCKLAIGTSFLLKKLQRLHDAEAGVRSTLAQAALDKVKSKGIVVAPAVQTAVEKFVVRT